MGAALRGVALRLHGPLQAWGGAVIGDDRPTLPFPTRSGVLGLIAACLGIRRDDSARMLALADGTRVHVRVDAAGTPMVDDQTIQGHPAASETRQTIQSKRTYLCDASFVAVVVPGPSISIESIATAVRQPVFAPSLGRRTCVPSTPLLAAAEVEAEGPISLFDGIPRGPAELLREIEPTASADERWLADAGGRAAERPAVQDFYLDVEHYAGAIRRIPLRDQLSGPLPRQWRERFALHVRAVSLPPSTTQGS